MPRPVTPAGILAATLAELVPRAAALGDDGLTAQLRRAADLAGGLEPYVAGQASPPSPALRELARRTHDAPWRAGLEAEMLSGHPEGRLLAFLVRLTRARRVLDVGMFTGYSALAMAEALPADGRVVACEVDREAAALARSCFAGSADGAKIDVRLAPALDTLAALRDVGARFDLVFVDADKSGYGDYLEAALGVLADGGLICVDNTLMQGEPWLDGQRSANGEAVAAFNAAVREDPRLEQVLLPVRDGLTLIRRA